MADALGTTLTTLKIVGIVSSIVTLVAFIGLPILKEFGDEETKNRLDPFLTSLMTISGIVTPLVWIIVFLVASLVPIAKQITNEVQGSITGGLQQATPLLQTIFG